MATLLDIVRDILDRMCLEHDINHVDVTDDTQRQIRALINEEGKDLTSSFDWQILVNETLTPAADDTNKISDQGLIENLCPTYLRICNNCLYLDGRSWPLVGPLSIQGRTYTKAGGMSFIDGYFIQNGHLYLTQPTNSTQKLRIAYITRCWAVDIQGNPKDKLMEDTDLPLLDERLLTLGAIWRWLSRNGLPYQQEWLNYNTALIQAKSADRPHTNICCGTRGRYNPRRSIVGGTAITWS